jgi:predicted dehydrogenase
MLKAVFIGAGNRATSAHYPALARAASKLELRAVCDLDTTRLNEVADRFDIGGRYTDFHEMLADVECEVVYAVMRPWDVAEVAIEVLNSGKHLFIEKPPGAGSADAERIAEAATRNGKFVCVGLQRRWTPLLRQAISRVAARGPIRFMMTNFHKNLIEIDEGGRNFSRLYEQDIHMIDFTRWVCGGEWDEVLSRGDDAYTEWMNAYNSIINFSSGAVAVHSAIGHAGARYYRIELHGNGISAYLHPPTSGEIFTDNSPKPEVIHGEPIPGDPDGRLDEGVDAMHLDFLECIADGREPLTSIHETVHSMHLAEEIGRLDSSGKPRSG